MLRFIYLFFVNKFLDNHSILILFAMDAIFYTCIHVHIVIVKSHEPVFIHILGLFRVFFV